MREKTLILMKYMFQKNFFFNFGIYISPLMQDFNKNWEDSSHLRDVPGLQILPENEDQSFEY